jgi:outer membrane receptor protein involved in Fe transport
MIPGTDKPLPIDISYRGNKFGYDLESKSHSVFLEQIFFNKLFTEFAWYRQETDRDWDRSNGGTELYVDVLEYLPNKDPDVKVPNPNVGKIFTQGHLRIQEQYREIEVVRFTAGFELDLSESASWLGRHRFGLLLENSRDLLGLNDYVDVNLLTDRGAFANNLPNFGNRVVRRSYLFGEDGMVWNPGGGPGLPGYSKISGTVDPNSVQSESGDPFETGLVNFRVSRGETEVDSWVISMQSFFPAPGFGNVSERLIPFWGIRGDDQVSTQLISADMNAAKERGVFPDWWTLPYDVASTFDDTTLTWGLVYRLTPGISFFYNSSEVLAPGSSRQNVFGKVIDPSTGDGWDAGIRFELFDGKLVGSLSYFEATQFNIPRFNVFGGQTGEPFNNFIEALQNWDEAPSHTITTLADSIWRLLTIRLPDGGYPFVGPKTTIRSRMCSMPATSIGQRIWKRWSLPLLMRDSMTAIFRITTALRLSSIWIPGAKSPTRNLLVKEFEPFARPSGDSPS